ncbi:MAG: hypothetical protein B6I31_05500 [Desulfobacteraceae bacterium 4572_19]|nr:MAG: hypothetical protein B6I31_05500 [Desulfobacteraceae bacterium 4572_19]
MGTITGVGTKFRRWDANATSSGGAWEEIGEITGIDGPGKSRDTVETTTLSVEDGYRTFIGALRDGGEVALSMNFTAATYAIMNEDFESDTPGNYEIVLPDEEETSFEFVGLVTNLPLAIPLDDKITCDTTIKISGKPVINSGAASGAPA